MKKFDFKRIIRYFNYRSENGVSINVLRDWKAVFYCFIVLAVSFSLLDAYLFLKYQEELKSEIDTGPVQEEVLITVNRNSLNSVLEELKRKERQFEKKLSEQNMKDPSR